MKIIYLYTKNKRFPYISLAVTILCVLVTVAATEKPEYYNVLAWKYPADNLWQYFGGAFLHGVGNGDLGMTFAYLCVLQLLFLPHAVMSEKVLGHLRFGCIFLIAWVSNSVVFQIVSIFMSNGEVAYGAGLSGIVYALCVTSFYILAQTFFMDKKGFWRQPLSYIFLMGFVGCLLVLNPVIAGVGSFIIHLCGLVTGVIATRIFRKSISVSLIMKREKLWQSAGKSNFLQ